MAEKISFSTRGADVSMMMRVIDRAMNLGIYIDPTVANMDLLATHANGCQMDFEGLWKTPNDGDFAHDVGGIKKNLNRKTGKLDNHFLPRFAKPEIQTDPVPTTRKRTRTKS